jgi:hypothetical protein
VNFLLACADNVTTVEAIGTTIVAVAGLALIGFMFWVASGRK